MSYDQYQETQSTIIHECIEQMRCQPILFVGTGMSRRYFGAPNWVGLMEELIKGCSSIDKSLAYYQQKHTDLIDVATQFAIVYREWAWSAGRVSLPTDLFQPNVQPEAYLKFKTAEIIDSITPLELAAPKAKHKPGIVPTMLEEVRLLKQTCPHAIITTNYDRFLDVCFPEYKCIIGQQVLRADHTSIGEIFKIHGCTSDHNSLVVTRNDYDHFMGRLKYLNALLFTYFVEHPIFFLGYSVNDPNIKAILTDINEMLSPNGELVPNIFFVTWDAEARTRRNLASDEMIPLGEGKFIRVRKIVASDYEWIYRAIARNSAIGNVNVKLLRGLLSRVKQLVRSDIPSGECHVNYETIEGIVEENDKLETILGVSRIDRNSNVNIEYPYTISMLQKKLKIPGNWHTTRKLIDRVLNEKGVDICGSDNQYHINMKLGEVSARRKYSEEMFVLLKKMHAGLPYEVNPLVRCEDKEN